MKGNLYLIIREMVCVEQNLFKRFRRRFRIREACHFRFLNMSCLMLVIQLEYKDAFSYSGEYRANEWPCKSPVIHIQIKHLMQTASSCVRPGHRLSCFCEVDFKSPF